MKLIDADKLFDAMEETEWYNNADRDEIAERLIMDAPSIDIVRCKECRWGKPYSDKQLECDALGLGGLKFPDDFCSCGERKESE